MTAFPGWPRLPKGQFVGLDSANPLTSVILFQYNPNTVTRRLDARTSGGAEGADKSEALLLTGRSLEKGRGK